MRDASIPAEVALYRKEEDGPYRIGVSPRAAEHALGIVDRALDVVPADGGWRFSDAETGAEYRDVSELLREGRVTVLSDYPVTGLRDVLEHTLRHFVWSSLIVKLVVRGIRNPTEWRFDADHSELRLRDPEGRLRARVEHPRWWLVASRSTALELADRLVEETGLEVLGAERLAERRREE